jgi:hypothetical protein
VTKVLVLGAGGQIARRAIEMLADEDVELTLFLRDAGKLAGGGRVTPRWPRGKGGRHGHGKAPDLAAAARTWEVVAAGEALPPELRRGEFPS